MAAARPVYLPSNLLPEVALGVLTNCGGLAVLSTEELISLQSISEMVPVLLPLLLSLSAAPLVVIIGCFRPRWTAGVAVLLAALAFAATLWGWASGGGMVSFPWAPTWGLNISLELDGLAALYALLATGVGLAVLVYSSGYMPHHLEKEKRPGQDTTAFYALVLLFMGAMVGLVMAQDLILLFLFWDVTTITSYFLISYDRHKLEARRSSLTALIITGVASLGLLIGALMLDVAYGSFSLPALPALIEPGPYLTTAGALMIVAALAKSAQIPLHFWLPRAMVAPTPVSSYLHSAAMVAAGVFLLQRLYPILEPSPVLLNALLGIGLTSMFIGGMLALAQDRLKRLLAYSTISQYGYVVTMLGLGGEAAVVGSIFYVLAHGLMKSALFLTAGTVTYATGQDQLSRLGGLARPMWWLALGSGVAAAGLAALPLTLGFFKDELFFEGALERGWPFALVAMVGAGLTLAYAWRFWGGLFTGAQRSSLIYRPGPALLVPILVLGALVILGGLWPTPFATLANQATIPSLGEAGSAKPAYHFDLRPANLLALGAYGVGLLLVVTRWVRHGAAGAVVQAGRRWGPAHQWQMGLRKLDRISDRIYWTLVPNLGGRITAVVLAAGLLVLLAVLVLPSEGTYRIGFFTWREDWGLVIALVITAAGGILTSLPRDHLTQVLGTSVISYGLVAVFAIFSAPNVAVVMALITIISGIFFFAVLTMLPTKALMEQAAKPERFWWRNALVGLVAGVLATAVAWSVLSQEPAAESIADEMTRLTPDVHAKDIVTAILADFRGLDTMGEITVIAVVLLGLLAVLRLKRDES